MKDRDDDSETQDFPAYLRANFATAIERINKDGLLPTGLGFDSVVESALLRYGRDRSSAHYEAAEKALEEQVAGVHEDG